MLCKDKEVDKSQPFIAAALPIGPCTSITTRISFLNSLEKRLDLPRELERVEPCKFLVDRAGKHPNLETKSIIRCNQQHLGTQPGVAYRSFLVAILGAHVIYHACMLSLGKPSMKNNFH